MALLPSFSVKDVLELLKKGAQVEAEEKIMELRTAALDFQEENIQLRHELAALTQQLALQNLAWDGKVYWVKLPDRNDPSTADPSNGPFCPHCADTTHKRVRLQDYRVGYAAPGWYCTACKELFATAPAQPIRVIRS